LTLSTHIAHQLVVQPSIQLSLAHAIYHRHSQARTSISHTLPQWCMPQKGNTKKKTTKEVSKKTNFCFMSQHRRRHIKSIKLLPSVVEIAYVEVVLLLLLLLIMS